MFYLLIFACFAAVHGQGACPDGYKLFGASCYKYINQEKTWVDAKQSCASMGAFLAEIVDQATNDFIVEMASRHNHRVIWLGGSDRVTHGQWVWEHSGISVDTFSDWAPNQPDTGSGSGDDENCMELNIDTYNSHWNDDQCYHKQRFICQVYADEEFIG